MSNRPEPNRNIKERPLPQLTQQQSHLLKGWTSENLNRSRCTEDQPPATETQSQRQTPPTPSSKPGRKRGYTAPNGTHLCDDELVTLADGVEDLKPKGVVYFQPCFIEDPWRDLKVVKIACTIRWWCVFLFCVGEAYTAYVCDGVYGGRLVWDSGFIMGCVLAGI
ncbi:hypothetical protein BDV29DRAFT_153305 [Aspergillus leporis]|uniref:Uncharacterized protein n=1 Tax=Aspergillus leporis TaxID=41062 RepID=A0A5N5XAM7_9EURO|nr:hypothetical protein BDV29DRAFT_153305 [Aspergillus leporis]